MHGTNLAHRANQKKSQETERQEKSNTERTIYIMYNRILAIHQIAYNKTKRNGMKNAKKKKKNLYN